MKELDKIEFVILTMSIIITYHNNMTYTNIAYMIGQNIIYNIYKKNLSQLFNSILIKVFLS